MRKKTAAAQATPAKTVNEPKPAVASILGSKPSPNGQPLSEEAIRLCAYGKWEAAGRPAGDGMRFWLEAEKELHDK